MACANLSESLADYEHMSGLCWVNLTLCWGKFGIWLACCTRRSEAEAQDNLAQNRSKWLNQDRPTITPK